MEVVVLLLVGIGSLISGILLGYLGKKKVDKALKKDTEIKAEEIIASAQKEAENLKEKKVLEAKEILAVDRERMQKENKRWQENLKKQEERLKKREQDADRRQDGIRKQEEGLRRAEEQIKKKQQELVDIKKREIERFEELAGINKDEIKRIFIGEVEQEAKHEAAKIVKKIEDEATEEGEKKAKEIVAQAVTRCAAEYVTESTVSVVPLPSEDMKGRVIGREGRNIRAFEEATGVELIVDDTPEAVTLSGYDPVRREIARIALGRLITDGRIHPGRIEEIVNKAKQDVDKEMQVAAKDAVLGLGIHDLTQREMELLGRLKFRTSYGQNVLRHSIEVAHIAQVMASELRLKNLHLVKKAALLHDIGKAIDSQVEGSHIEIAGDILKQAGESPMLINAVMAHHEDVKAESVEAILIQAADAVSAARPGARRENLEGYVKRLERLENVATSFAGVEKAYAIQAGREIRVIVNSDEMDDVKTSQLAREVAKKVESELEYPGSIKVTVIREKRVIEYAK